MRTPSTLRRSIALLATTGLVSGGLGALAAPAHALVIPAVVVSKVAPDSWDNRTSVTVTITRDTGGGPFAPQDSLVLQPACSDDPTATVPADNPCAPLTGPEVANLTYPVDAAAPNATSTTAKLDLSMAPPGRYLVVYKHVDGTTSSPWTLNGALKYFDIFAYGGAVASSSAHGEGVESIDPFGIDCTFIEECGRAGTGPLDIRGSNIAIGASVSFLKPDNTVDNGMTFTPGNEFNGDNARKTHGGSGTGYPSSTLLQGNYNALLNLDNTPKFTPGWHKLKITNTDGKTAPGGTIDFAQPYFPMTGALSFPTAANPNPAPSATIGQGSKNRVLRVTGQGIRAGSVLTVQNKGNSNCDDLSVGSSTLGGVQPDGTYTTIEAPLTFADCSASDVNNEPRAVGIIGPEGARFFRGDVLQVGGFPTFSKFSDASFQTMGQGAHEGFGGPATNGLLVTGANFQGAGETDPAKMVSFDFGPGVTAVTRQVNPTGASAFVSIDIDPSAGTGQRTVRATNPDGGSKVSDCTRLASGDCNPQGANPKPPLTITVGPKVTKLAVAADSLTQGMTPGQALPTKYDVTGTGFQASGYGADGFIVALPGQTTQDPNVQLQAVQRVSATQVTFQASAGPAAVAGPRDLIIVNDDHGRVVCEACLGIDSLSVTPNTAANTETAKSLALTVLVNGLPDFINTSTVTLSHQTPLPGQPDIVGTGVTATDAKHGSAVFDLSHAALGKYNITVVLDPAGTKKTAVCLGCFTVTGDAMALDATPVTPADGGQGVVDRLLTFKGTGFTKGMQVSIPDVTVHDVTYVSPTQITAKVDIAPDALTGAKSSTVTGGDGVSKTFTFTVNPAPEITSSTPAAYGAGAGSAGSPTPAPPFQVTGNGFVQNPVTQLDLGPKIEAAGEAVDDPGTPPTYECLPDPIGCVETDPGSDGHVDATLAIAQDAASGKRAVSVVNNDGGRASLADAFTVNPGPKITTVSNASGAPVLCKAATGVTCTNPQPITVLGSDFPQLTLAATNEDKAKAFQLQNTNGTPATGVTVSNIVFAPGKITADVTVDPARAYGPLRVAIFNDADKGFGTCDTCVFVANKPATVTGLKLVGVGSGIKATWTGPTGSGTGSNGAPITGYHASIQKVGSATISQFDIAAGTLTKTFTGLLTGSSYVVRVQAVNAAGAGTPASATGIAGAVTTLTSTASSKLITAGSAVRFSGKLVSGTAPVSGRTVRLTFVRTVGSTFSKYVTTNSVGGWSYVIAPTYTFTMTAAFLGDSTYRASSAAKIPVSVRSKVVITSPSSTSTSRVGTTIKLTGYVLPNHRGSYVYLYRFVNGSKVLVQRTTLSSSSTYVFSGNPTRGTYVFRVYIGNTKGNLANYSNAITVKRT